MQILKTDKKLRLLVMALIFQKSLMLWKVLVMGRTTFHRTLNKLEHHFFNIEQTQTCSFIGDQTQVPEFWFLINELRT